MPRFQFEAMDSNGEARAHHVQAENAEEAMRMLRTRGLFVSVLKEVTDSSDEAGSSEASATASDADFSSENSAERVGRPPGRWFGAIFTAVGLACAAIGLGSMVDSVWFGMRSERASAIVVEPARKRGEVEKLEFTASGRQYRVEARGTFGIRWGNNVGLRARVDVLYPPDHPENARRADFAPRFVMPLFALVLGLVFTPCGVLILRRGIGLKT